MSASAATFGLQPFRPLQSCMLDHLEDMPILNMIFGQSSTAAPSPKPLVKRRASPLKESPAWKKSSISTIEENGQPWSSGRHSQYQDIRSSSRREIQGTRQDVHPVWIQGYSYQAMVIQTNRTLCPRRAFRKSGTIGTAHFHKESKLGNYIRDVQMLLRNREQLH